MSKKIDNTHNVRVFFGEEQLLIDETIERIKNQLNVNFINLNYSTFNELSSIEDILSSALSIPFGDKFRIINIEAEEMFSVKYKIFDNEKEKLIEYLKNPSDSTIMIFVSKSIDKRSQLWKIVKDRSFTKEFSKLSSADFKKWCKERFEIYNKKIDTTNLDYFCSVSGYDFKETAVNLYEIKSEIKKISSQSYTEKIEKADIDSQLIKQFDSNIFKFIDYIFEKKYEMAMQVYNSLIESKVSPIFILSMISRQISILISLKITENIAGNKAKILSLHPFVIKKNQNLIRNYSISYLSSIYKETLDIDYRIKSGKLTDALGVEILISKIAN